MSDHFLLGAMPSCLTILLLIFLISLTIRDGKTQRESQLFTMVCLIHLAHHTMIILGTFLTSEVQILYMFRFVHLGFIFILPVSVHYVHCTLNLAHTKKMITILYGAALSLLPFVVTDHYFLPGQDAVNGGVPLAGPLFFLFLLTALVFLVAYAVLITVRIVTNKNGFSAPLNLKALYILIGLFPTCLLTFGDALPLFGFRSFSVGGFVFIPMGIFTYGILRHQTLGNKGWFSMGYIPNFLTTMVWLPLVLAAVFFAMGKDTLFYPDVLPRLYPLALPAMVSVLVCFILASFCFQKGTRQVQTMVFGGVCALWGLMNLDITLLFILRDSQTALQLNRFDHFFLVMQLGFCSHLFYYFADFRKWMVYVAYGISLVFVPLTQTSLYLTGTYNYPWGLFGARGILFDILISIALVKITMGCVVLARKITAAPPGSDLRKQALFFLVGVLSMGAFGLSNIPAMSGVDFYPLGTFMFVPVLLMAYGVFRFDVIKINMYSKRRLWSGMAIVLIYTGYILIGVAVYVTLKPLSGDLVISRVMESGIPLLLSMGVCVFFSVLSLRVGPSLVGSRLFGLICLIFAFLSTDILLNSLVTHAETGLRISRLNHIFLVMWPALHLHLVVLVCRKKKVMPLVRFYYATGVFFTLFSQSPWYLSGVVHYSWGFFAQRGVLFDGFCALGTLNFLFSLRLFYLTRREQTQSLDRQRLTLFSLGLGASALFTAGNIPAMSGYDLYPPGNYVFIPITLFGYAMFRKNLKEVLVLLSQLVYGAGVLGFLTLIAYAVHRAGISVWSWGTVFSGIVAGLILFSAYKAIWGTVLSLFFGRQKEVLDKVYVRLIDQLSKARSLNDIVDYIAGPLYQELYVRRLRILFYSDPDQRFLVFEGLNPNAVADTQNMTAWEHRVSFAQEHPLFPFFRKGGGVITQAQVEAWIVDEDIGLSSDDILRSADLIQPVYSETSLISLVLFYGKEDGSVFSKIEKEFIGRIGFILGPYIENAKLLQGLEREIEKRTGDLSAALDEITLINRFIKTANASLNLDDILMTLLGSLETIFRFETVIVQLVDLEADQVSLSKIHGHALTPEKKDQLESMTVPLKDSASLSAWCVKTGKRAYLNRFEPDLGPQGFEKAMHEISPFTSILILPMEIRNEVIGNIVFLSGAAPFNFSEKDMEKLQGYVTQITSAVNNASLYDKAEAAAKAKSDFLARMSHEIRSPLNAILGMGDLLTETPLNKEQAQYIDILTNSSGLLLSVINDILDFSKLEAGRVAVECIPFDLFRLMNDLKHIIGVSSVKKGLFVDLSFSSEVDRHVCGDPFKLAQVIMNLADNAIRFTEKGGITIHVSPLSDATPNRMVQFCVEDSGMGIASDKIAMIFESFSQAESSTTRRYGGTGLGLTISKNLIHLMGGTISVTSADGCGSRFYFNVAFPGVSKVSPSGSSQVNTSRLRLKSRFESSGDTEIQDTSLGTETIRVLLAEDMRANIQVVRLYLKTLPVILDVAQDGVDAVRMFQSRHYDLVLMDIHMPRMDGYEAVSEIRDWEKTHGRSSVPVIALSAHVPDGGRLDEPGDFDDFLMKPFTRHALISKVERLIDFSNQPPKPDTLPIIPSLDPELALILPELVKEITEELVTMTSALDKHDFSTVSRLSHGFKGAAGNFGITELSDMFMQLHDHAGTRNYELAMAMVTSIRDYMAAFSVPSS